MHRRPRPSRRAAVCDFGAALPLSVWHSPHPSVSAPAADRRKTGAKLRASICPCDRGLYKQVDRPTPRGTVRFSSTCVVRSCCSPPTPAVEPVSADCIAVLLVGASLKPRTWCEGSARFILSGFGSLRPSYAMAFQHSSDTQVASSCGVWGEQAEFVIEDFISPPLEPI